jgi:DNA modification methylase
MAKRNDEISGDNTGRELLAMSRQRRERFNRLARARATRGRRRNNLTPELALALRRPEELHVPARNVRKLNAAQVARVAAAIETLGFCQPLLITAAGEVIDGAARLQAAKQLGLREIACLVVDHLSDAEVRTLRIALNRLGERGEWDFEALRLEFTELIELGAPIEVAGFEAPEMDIILLGDEPPEHEIGPLEPDEADPIAQDGDIWRLDEHLLACGDARDPAVYGALMGSDQARLVFTDPPYNVPIAGHVTRGRHREFEMASGELSRAEFGDFNLLWISAAIQWLVEGGLVMPFIDWRSVALMIDIGESLSLGLLNLIVWAKDNAGQGALWRSQHEFVPVFKLGTAPHVNNIEMGRHGRRRSNVWQYPGASSMGSDAREGLKEHPTVKPVALIEDALLDVTNRGEVVVDPFLGSGSTLIAAEKTGRICRGIEIDTRYVDVALRRWARLTGRTPELVQRARARERPQTRPRLLPAPPLALSAPKDEGRAEP